MHSFEFHTIKTEYPGNWNELNKDQLLFISYLFDSGLEMPSFNTLALQYFTGVKWKLFFSINAEVLQEMAETIKFLHETKELTINLLPTLEIGKKTLYGPADQMRDVSFEQFFGHLEPSFSAFAKDNNKEMFDYFIAALYSFKNGKFDADLIEVNKELVKDLKHNYKTAILFFYLGCRDLFSFKFPKLFSNKKTNIQANDLHYEEMIENLNNENISNNETIKKSNIYEAFVRLTAMIEKADNLKRNKK